MVTAGQRCLCLAVVLSAPWTRGRLSGLLLFRRFTAYDDPCCTVSYAEGEKAGNSELTATQDLFAVSSGGVASSVAIRSAKSPVVIRLGPGNHSERLCRYKSV